MTRACREAGGHMREGAEAFRPRDFPESSRFTVKEPTAIPAAFPKHITDNRSEQGAQG